MTIGTSCHHSSTHNGRSNGISISELQVNHMNKFGMWEYGNVGMSCTDILMY